MVSSLTISTSSLSDAHVTDFLSSPSASPTLTLPLTPVSNEKEQDNATLKEQLPASVTCGVPIGNIKFDGTPAERSETVTLLSAVTPLDTFPHPHHLTISPTTLAPYELHSPISPNTTAPLSFFDDPLGLAIHNYATPPAVRHYPYYYPATPVSPTSTTTATGLLFGYSGNDMTGARNVDGGVLGFDRTNRNGTTSSSNDTHIKHSPNSDTPPPPISHQTQLVTLQTTLAARRQKNTEAARRSRQKKAVRMRSLEERCRDLEVRVGEYERRLRDKVREREEFVVREEVLRERIRVLEEMVGESHRVVVGLIERCNGNTGTGSMNAMEELGL